MKLNWFTRKGIIYLPISIIGWIIFGIALFYAAFTFINIDKHSHSTSGTLINFVFNLLLTGLMYTLIAYFTEKKPVPDAFEK